MTLCNRNVKCDRSKVIGKELGPKFCLVETDIDRARFQKDLNAGFRRMKLADIFHKDGDSRSEEEKRFYVKSSWEPPQWKVNKSLIIHNQVVQDKFDHWKQPTRVASNVSVEALKAIKSLKNDDTIDIKMDDKSPCFVVADKKDYISSALNDLDKQSILRNLKKTLIKKT